MDMDIKRIERELNQLINERIKEAENENSLTKDNTIMSEENDEAFSYILSKFEEIVNKQIIENNNAEPSLDSTEIEVDINILKDISDLGLINLKEYFGGGFIKLSQFGCFQLLPNFNAEKDLISIIENEKTLIVKDISVKVNLPEWFIRKIIEYYEDNNIIQFNESMEMGRQVYCKI